ncbi:MAG: AtpZ/AtpI family protein [Nitrospirota bacterium]
MANGRSPIPPGGLGAGMRIGLELVTATMIGTGLGWLGDRYFGTEPWLMLAGVLIGVAAGLLNVYRFLKQLD